jgi:hypothetical protein
MRERRVIAEISARLFFDNGIYYWLLSVRKGGKMAGKKVFVPRSRFLDYKILLDEVRDLEEKLALKA